MAEFGKLNDIEIAEAKRLRELTSCLYLEHQFYKLENKSKPEYQIYRDALERLKMLQALCEHLDRFIRCPDCNERDPSI